MKYKKMVLYEIILLLFIVFVKQFLTEINHIDFLISFFWVISFIIIYKLIGFKKNNLSIKKDIIQITIIILMFYIVFTYMSGLYFGFLRNGYDLSFLKIIKNCFMPIIMIVFEELIRYIFAKKNKNDLIRLTILYCIFDVVLQYTSSQTNSVYLMFVFITATIIPIIARHILASYLCRKVSFVPGLIYRMYFGISMYILPIFPDIGNFLTSIYGIFFPYLIYFVSSKIIIKAEKEKIPNLNKKLYYLYIPIICSLLFVVALSSGIFKYHMIAIASGSMEPTFYRGDVIIYKKTNKIDKLKKGTPIVFKHNNKHISHRIVSVEKKGEKYIIQTKGDNNPDLDNYKITIDDVEGIIKTRIKYVGYPTVWFSELSN